MSKMVRIDCLPGTPYIKGQKTTLWWVGQGDIMILKNKHVAVRTWNSLAKKINAETTSNSEVQK